MAKNGHERNKVHVTETPDVSHIKNVDVTHETSDVNVSGILKFVIGLTIFGAIVSLLMGGMFWMFNEQEKAKEPKPGPMAMTTEERLPPTPRLQAARGFEVKLENGEVVKLEKLEPEAEYRVLREQWEQRLNCNYGDEKHRVQELIAEPIKCLSIDKAVDKLFEGGGLPVRPSAKDSGNPAESALPTAASSGRVTGMK